VRVTCLLCGPKASSISVAPAVRRQRIDHAAICYATKWGAGTYLSGDNLYAADIYDKDYETFVSCLRKGFKANNNRKAKAISGGLHKPVVIRLGHRRSCPACSAVSVPSPQRLSRGG